MRGRAGPPGSHGGYWLQAPAEATTAESSRHVDSGAATLLSPAGHEVDDHLRDCLGPGQALALLCAPAGLPSERRVRLSPKAGPCPAVCSRELVLPRPGY